MIMTNSEYTTICTILENRAYRYSDNDDTSSKEYKIHSNIEKRVRASKENSTQRYNAEQKAYLIDMLEEYLYINIEEHGNGNEEQATDIRAMIDKLKGRKPLDLCDLMCR